LLPKPGRPALQLSLAFFDLGAWPDHSRNSKEGNKRPEINTFVVMAGRWAEKPHINRGLGGNPSEFTTQITTGIAALHDRAGWCGPHVTICFGPAGR